MWLHFARSHSVTTLSGTRPSERAFDFAAPFDKRAPSSVQEVVGFQRAVITSGVKWRCRRGLSRTQIARLTVPSAMTPIFIMQELRSAIFRTFRSLAIRRSFPSFGEYFCDFFIKALPALTTCCALKKLPLNSVQLACLKYWVCSWK